MKQNIVLGVDIGGSHITVSQVDIHLRKLVPGTLSRIDVDGRSSRETIIAEWSDMIRRGFGKIPKAAWHIGIAMPGPVDYETGVCHIRDQNKFESLYDSNIKELLAESLGITTDDILMINDAAGFLAGEMFGGVARGKQRVLGLTLGTGLGSAVANNGSVIDADLWHAEFMGGRAEDFISAPWLLKEASAVIGDRSINVKQLAEKADSNKAVREVFARFGTQLGKFLAQHIPVYEAEVVVLGGNVSRAHHLFRDSLEQELLIADTKVPVLIAETGEAAALIGAAGLWEQVSVDARDPQSSGSHF